MSLLIITRTKE